MGKYKAEGITYRGIVFRRYPESPNWADQVYYTPGYLHRKHGVGRLHQEIWKDVHGIIPTGNVIHHIDGNPINNDLSNLQCLPGGEHLNNHGASMSEEKRQHLRDNMDAVRVYASRWHGSPEGREWHKVMGKMAWEGREPQSFICDQCGSEYQTISLSGNTRFCSNNCKSAWRRASGVDNEQRVCAKCGQSFLCNKYSVQRFCSRLCGQKERRSK